MAEVAQSTSITTTIASSSLNSGKEAGEKQTERYTPSTITLEFELQIKENQLEINSCLACGD